MEFLTTFKMTGLATAQIFLMGSVGYVLAKRGILDEANLKFLSRIVVNLLFPLFSFDQLIRNFSFTAYQNWWIFPLISFAITAGGFLIGWAASSIKDGMSYRREFIAIVGFQNSGFIPLVLVATMFTGKIAEVLYVSIFLFLIGFDLVIWSFGVWFLARQKVEKGEMGNLIGAPAVAIIASLILIFFGLDKLIPEAVMKPISMFGGCALPMAVIVVGGNMALINIFGANRKKVALVTFVKLILFPALVLGVLSFVEAPPLIGFLVILEAAVPSANSLSVIARNYHIDDQFLNQGVFFTNVASVFTLPVFLTLYLARHPLF